MTGDQDVRNAEIYCIFCILSLAFDYMFTLVTFIGGNYKIFQLNSEVHKINIWHEQDLHRPTVNLTV